jgi:hypothetical protein
VASDDQVQSSTTVEVKLGRNFLPFGGGMVTDARTRGSVRLCEQTGCQHVISQLLKGRHYQFPVDRAIFLTVLHRLFDPGSDRAADKWKKDYPIEGCESLQLHHLYRAMAWPGDELAWPEQADKTPLAPRCTKDLIEERLFAHRRDLFTELQLVFFDTTSIYFEGQGGEAIGRRGHSKDHRPDLTQMIVGVVRDGQGQPICCELWTEDNAAIAWNKVVDKVTGNVREYEDGHSLGFNEAVDHEKWLHPLRSWKPNGD